MAPNVWHNYYRINSLWKYNIKSFEYVMGIRIVFLVSTTWSLYAGRRWLNRQSTWLAMDIREFKFFITTCRRLCRAWCRRRARRRCSRVTCSRRCSCALCLASCRASASGSRTAPDACRAGCAASAWLASRACSTRRAYASVALAVPAQTSQTLRQWRLAFREQKLRFLNRPAHRGLLRWL